MKDQVVRIDAAAITDGTGFFAAPGSVLVEVDEWSGTRLHLPKLLAAGETGEVLKHPASSEARVIRRPKSLLIPGLVNAHTHLDLTHIGPRPHDHGSSGFVPWVDMIRRERRQDAAEIAESVRQGIALSLAGGSVAVGDIAGAPRGVPCLEPWRVLRESPLMGVSFLEFFSRGKYREQGLNGVLAAFEQGRLEELNHLACEDQGGSTATTTPLPLSSRSVRRIVRLGLQPHAPNTVARSSYQRVTALAIEHGAPICTHLAETVEEREFIAAARGPQRELLEMLGVWDDSAASDIGIGQHPAEYLEEVLQAAHAASSAESQRSQSNPAHIGERLPYLVAHVNDATDRTIEILAATDTRVAYCPRASSYFGAHHHFGPHRYREMLDAGIKVCLGTDSIVNLPPDSDAEGSSGMSIWHEIQLLHWRDGTDPFVLLRMGTTNGAAALGFPPDWFTFTSPTADPTTDRRIAGIVAINTETERSTRITADFISVALKSPSSIELL